MSRLFNITSSVIAITGCALGTPAIAQNVSGTVDATITLTSACEVNGSTGTSNVDFGTLDFGTHSTLFTSATAQVNGNGSGEIAVQCSPGADATLTFTGGLHDAAIGGSGRAMSDGTLFVPYDIYRDSAFNTVLANGASITITADGSIQHIPVYGRALGISGLAAGTYTDTISVMLAF
ncbi:spore coat U domain-containing protein [Sphingobium aquiterrae]|uniref:Csu type fimbrial protein n=1 Tax=Sphingobium aquiterrae TaxID=2038656 RepID=UPI00301ADA22